MIVRRCPVADDAFDFRGQIGTFCKSSPIGPGGTKTGGSNGASCTQQTEDRYGGQGENKERRELRSRLFQVDGGDCELRNERKQQDRCPFRHHGSIVAQHDAVFVRGTYS